MNEGPILKKIQVLIVDDSPLMQAWLKRILSADPEVGEVTVAQNADEARQSLQTKRPDVITLDVELPGMDGISFLKEIMSHYPLPVVMVSAYTQENCQTTIKALSLGAMDFIPKPGPGLEEEKETFPQRLLDKVKEAAQARTVSPLLSPPSHLFHKGMDISRRPFLEVQGSVIGIGASTGGTLALNFLLSQLPEDMPPIADHLDQVSLLTVKEACSGDRLKRGLALIIPGGKHGQVQKDQQGIFLTLNENPPVNHHRPSVDVLFQSLALTVQEKGIGILLTGMGEDGARGLLAMREQRARTLAQDESTSAVFGMPQAAIKLGAAQEVVPLEGVPDWLIKMVRR
jgi:two-component system chemotaxis response regulator CheB